MLPYHHNPLQDHVRLLSSSHNPCPTFPIGSLTTLLIGHLATLQLGDHLEFYVTLTGALKKPIYSNALLHGANISVACCTKFFSQVSNTHFLPVAFSSSSIEMHVMSSSTSSDTGRLPPTGACYPWWLSSAAVWIPQAPPSRRRPHNPDMGRRHCQSKITALPSCLQVLPLNMHCTVCTQTNTHNHQQ